MIQSNEFGFAQVSLKTKIAQVKFLSSVFEQELLTDLTLIQ